MQHTTTTMKIIEGQSIIFIKAAVLKKELIVDVELVISHLEL